MIIGIWAMDCEGIIGKNNKLPWYEPEEMKHFQDTTNHKTVLFGRITYENLPIKPLPNRKNIIITTKQNWKPDGENVLIIHNLIKLLKEYQDNKLIDLYICGGASIYEQSWLYMDYLIISIFHDKYDGDTKFPNLDMTHFKLNNIIKKPKFNILYYKKK